MKCFPLELLIATLVSTGASATTIDLSKSVSSAGGGAGFYVVDNSFDLPANFTNAVLSITRFVVDDRGALLLNGVVVDAAGVFGPGGGLLQLTADGAAVPYTFADGNGDRRIILASGFTPGRNAFSIVVNDTGAGIAGATLDTAGPTGFVLAAELAYDVAPVPEPGAWALLALGLASISVRRVLKQKPIRHPSD